MDNSSVLLSRDLMLVFLLYVLALAIPLAFYVIFLYIQRYEGSMVDGPKRFPVVGSLFAFWNNRSRQSEWYTEMLADSPTQTIVVERFGGIRTVVTANPENVEHILKTRFDNYPKGQPFTAILHDLLGRGIFNSDGDAWKLQRKVACYEFSTRSLRNFVLRVVGAVTDRLLTILEEASERGSCLDLQDILQRFALDNICNVAFGVDPASLDRSLPVSEFAQAFDAATELSALRSTAPISLVWKLKRMFKLGSEKRLFRAVEIVHHFAMDVIRQRRGEMAESAPYKQDLLSRFMALANLEADVPERDTYRSEEFLRDSIISFVLAGRDTTSAALTWFFLLLTSHPHVEEAIHKEIARFLAAKTEAKRDGNPLVFAYEDLQNMHYLHASLCESMRLYPPVLFDSKHALHDDVLPDGTFVGKGTRVTYHPYAMGRMEAIWGADCLQFKPERWVNEAGHFVPQSPFKFAVFQGGARICLGKDMAFIQMKYVAATVISMFRLRRPVEYSAAGAPKLIHSLTARMKGGFPVQVEKRKVD